MAEYVVEFGKDGRPVETTTAGWTQRRSIATIAPIWAVLQKFLAGKSGDVLEAGSGTGQHVVHFARHAPDITWWPSDLNERASEEHRGVARACGLANIRPPLRIDLSDPAWCPPMQDGSGPGELLAVFCANVIHIAPWRVAEEPVRRRGALSARRRAAVPLWPVQARRQAHRAQQRHVRHQPARARRRMGRARYRRSREAGRECGGLALVETVEVPANNLILVFARR